MLSDNVGADSNRVRVGADSNRVLIKTARFIEHNGLMNKAGKYIVALSGGADSVTLLLVLQELGYNISAAHCNFNLRGEESHRDEMFCVSLCKQRNIELHRAHFDTRQYATLHKVSIEMAARELRYGYFRQLKHDINADAVCVAHHSDDTVETVLMNLIRGTGLQGLTGIQPVNGDIVRPLLCISRNDIEEFLESRGQQYVTDSSNLVDDVTRNRLRLDVVPLLQTINPAVTSCIVRTARHMTEAAKVLNHSLQQSAAECITVGAGSDRALSSNGQGTVGADSNRALSSNGQATVGADSDRALSNSGHGCCTISIGKLMTQPSPEYTLFFILRNYGFTAMQTEDIYRNIGATTGTQYSSATSLLLFDRGNIIIEPLADATDVMMKLPEVGVYVINDSLKIRIETIAADTVGAGSCLNRPESALIGLNRPGPASDSNRVLISKDPHCCTIDARGISFPLILRTTRPGDRFRPFGMNGTRLISDYLTDKKRTRLQKLRQLVLTDADDNILWLVGERTDDRHKVTPSTETMIRATLTDG